ncbi:uncharacterized protein AB675_9577 [Cyphellophora attinorum]|uniref:Heterokaryon incompatibility domain-containing protein n=1 Tax=Cyphellophora attinorum TaxID=1664694 RepID=A0A0N1HDG8_9EURO|nr:uncharacterized protein AB675_9577 [Phialophora attinorum]KPI42446.1 hypothetical protein AB675_9577 [Phialophora attinorum]
MSLLEPHPEWSALSYTWGPPIKGRHLDDKQILVAGQIFTVTGNLFDALTRFRWAPRARQMWVDAICINQDDMDERSRQVAMMARIYSQATSVLIWLGHDSAYLDAHFTFTLLKSIRRYREEMIGLQKWIQAYRDHTGYEPNFEELDQRLVDIILQPTGPFSLLKSSPTWQVIEEGATQLQDQGFIRNLNKVGTRHPLIVTVCTMLQKFFDRRYFSRRWVLQEIFHGKSTQITCGQQSMMWYDFEESHRSLWLVNGLVANRIKRLQFDIPTAATTQVSLSWRTQQRDGQLPAKVMLDLLLMFNSAECEDVRDRLFSLLSFDSRFQLLPDYTMSVSQVCLQFARVCIQSGLFESVLSAALNQIDTLRDGVTRRLDLQSWVPDLSIEVRSDDRAIEVTEGSQAATNTTVDADGRLSCSLLTFGTIEIHNGWALLGPNIPADVLTTVLGLHTGPDTIPLVDLQAKCWPKLVALEEEPRLEARDFTDLAVWTFHYMDAPRRSSKSGRSESGPSGLFDGDLLCKTSSGWIAHDLFAIRPGSELTDAGELIYTVVGKAIWGYWNEEEAPAGELRRFLIA